jgi:tRNA threonylcarbamoyladenosine biosynthesis protein TsaE
MKFSVTDPVMLDEVGKKLFSKYPEQKVFAIYGAMGAGKTTFIKRLCKILKASTAVISPTFTIINEYETKNHELIYHFDFYRIKDLREYEALSCSEYFISGNYCFIEWPERFETSFPDDFVSVIITDKNGKRIIEF